MGQWSTPGRPRASGGRQVAPQIRLSQAELTPFRAGRRLAQVAPGLLDQQLLTLADVSPHLGPGERRYLLDVADDYFLQWVRIGMSFAELEQAVSAARRP